MTATTSERKVFGRNGLLTFPLFLLMVIAVSFAIAQFVEGNSGAGVVFLVWGVLLLLGVLSLSSKKLIIEDEKVVIKSGLWFKSIHEVRYDKINTINLYTGGGLEIFAGNDKPLRFSGVEKSHEAKEAIERKMQGKSKGVSAEHSDLDQLEKLAKLYKEGILTKEEFEAKKKKLLKL